MLRVVSPSPRFFDLLITDEKAFGVYKPLMIEICKEIITPSTEEADSLTDFLIDFENEAVCFHTAVAWVKAARRYGKLLGSGPAQQIEVTLIVQEHVRGGLVSEVSQLVRL